LKNEFDNKAKEFAIGRPTYPKEILNKLKELGIEKQSIIADIGAGTGIFTNMLGQLGCRVLAVEPNVDMLNECREYCSNNTNIKYINATAENTELKENSVDIITIQNRIMYLPIFKVIIIFYSETLKGELLWIL